MQETILTVSHKRQIKAMLPNSLHFLRWPHPVSGRGECGSKPAVWIDGGIHAREWVSPATTTWMLKELVENDAAHPDLLENLDWFILPSANPDGYDWSRNHNRMWRKTRSSNGGILGCKVGICLTFSCWGLPVIYRHLAGVDADD